MQIGLRQLCKIQLNHLLKYHNSIETQKQNIRCILWKRYLQKFENDNYYYHSRMFLKKTRNS